MISRPHLFHPVIIVGAGASGLALAQQLVRVGVPVHLLEAESRVAEPWRRRHPQLRLNTHRRNSRLSGRGMPRATGTFAHRNDVVEYLEDYARDVGVPIEFGVRAVRLDPLGGCWRIVTTRGDRVARHVAIATGRERVPMVPDWSGLPGFAGEVIHAADLGDVRRYKDRRVLVAGAGNSGVDVLHPGRASGIWFLGMRPRLQGAFRAACAEGKETALLIRRQLQHVLA